jgi:hypothetical protein
LLGFADEYFSVSDLFVERFSKLESLRLLNGLILYVTEHASCDFLKLYLDYFFIRFLHLGCLAKFMQQTQRNEIYPDFRPNTFIAAMKMADLKECPDKQLLLFDRLLRYYDTSSVVFPTALQAIHNKTKLNFRQLLDHMMQIYRRKCVYLSTTEIISTLDYDGMIRTI